MCGSRKYPSPHHRGSLKILRERGVLKAKMFKGKYEPKLEFPEGWAGFKLKNPLWREYGYSLEQHNGYFCGLSKALSKLNIIGIYMHLITYISVKMCNLNI